jgi:hypothetical protein
LPANAKVLPILGAFWTITIFALWFMVIFAVIWAFIDNFARRDHSGWAKAGWAAVIILLPLLGTLIYIVARPPEVV